MPLDSRLTLEQGQQPLAMTVNDIRCNQVTINMVASSIIDKAFTERPDLKKRTHDAIGTALLGSSSGSAP